MTKEQDGRPHLRPLVCIFCLSSLCLSVFCLLSFCLLSIAVVRSRLPMALRTRVWTAGKLVLLVTGLVGTYVLFAFASMRIALRTREVQVPDFTSRTANEATAI